MPKNKNNLTTISSISNLFIVSKTRVKVVEMGINQEAYFPSRNNETKSAEKKRTAESQQIIQKNV